MAPNTPGERPAEGNDILKSTESLASSPHTLMAALDALKKFAGGNGALTFPGKAPEEAKQLIGMKDRLRAELPALAELIESRASTNVGEINQFLKSKGFNIQLRDLGGSGVYVASTFKQEVEWQRPGKETTIQLRESEKEVPGVAMKNVQKYPYRLPDGTATTIYLIKATNGDTVGLMPYNGHVQKGSLLKFSNEVVAPAAAAAGKALSTVERARAELNDTDVRNDGAAMDAMQDSGLKVADTLEFPMVDLNEKVNLSWLQGASIGGTVIRQAVAEFQLQMDEKGAVAKAAVGLGGTRGLPPPAETIDGPMVVWFERNGVVTFSSLVGTDDFKKPNRK